MKWVLGWFAIALAWGIGWAAIGAVFWVAVTVAGLTAEFDAVVVYSGLLGLIGGVFFGVVLGIARWRFSFGQMSVVRWAAWCATGWAIFSILVLEAESGQVGLVELAFLCVLPLIGAGSASGSLMTVRRLAESS